jgi:predicted amidohydrolase YtcJ
MNARKLLAAILLACVSSVVLVCLQGCEPGVTQADLILLNGKITTLDDSTPNVEALAARDGIIIAIGSNQDIETLRGTDTEVLDLDGSAAIPGFIEGHGHFTGIGESLTILDLRNARSWDEIVALAAAAASQAAPGEWIRGRGWHQEKWDTPPQPAVEGYPTHDALSRVAPDNPVWFRHASGHASIVNARALEAAGIDRQTADPEGGKILRDSRGQATGLLRETASDLVYDTYELVMAAMPPAERDALVLQKIELASAECLSKGITSFHDAGASLETVKVYQQAAAQNRLGPRLWVMLRDDLETLEREAADYRMIDTADHHLTVRAIKVAIDGALGSHGAWLLEPYTDLSETSGLNTTPLEEIERLAALAIESGMQLCVHAIGDRANRETLDIFERAFETHPELHDPRWRIEHAQHLDPTDRQRFVELGVIAAMQGIHCTSDGPWVPEKLGEQRSREGAYVWRDLIDAGVTIVNGTDAPVEDVDPIAGFYASVTRLMNDGEPFYPDQRMTRLEALRSYTTNAAYAAFEEENKGTLSVGMFADITILSRDIMTVADEQIPGTDVLYTIVGGRVAYRKPGA